MNCLNSSSVGGGAGAGTGTGSGATPDATDSRVAEPGPAVPGAAEPNVLRVDPSMVVRARIRPPVFGYA